MATESNTNPFFCKNGRKLGIFKRGKKFRGEIKFGWDFVVSEIIEFQNSDSNQIEIEVNQINPPPKLQARKLHELNQIFVI